MTGLYIHIPFCIQKCKYCDFVSYTGKNEIADAYIDALEREAAEYKGRSVDTIFIGGGTPTALTARQLRRVCAMCFDSFDVNKGYEFTVEANPGTIDEEKITALLEGGVNRVSVGVQSFNNAELRKIGRIHNAKTAYNTICSLKKSGFSNISLDLMLSLPLQTRESIADTLKTAVSLPVKHISAYSLMIEENTPLWREYKSGSLSIPDEDTEREIYWYTVCFLRANGFFQYEISNFAAEGYECRHNVNYWRCGEYAGLGAASHSHMNGKRYSNAPEPERYIAGAPRVVNVLTDRDKISEFIITGLRMNKGISGEEFAERFGADIRDMFAVQLEKFTALKLMKYENGRWSLTPRGVDISNSVLCEFV